MVIGWLDRQAGQVGKTDRAGKVGGRMDGGMDGVDAKNLLRELRWTGGRMEGWVDGTDVTYAMAKKKKRYSEAEQGLLDGGGDGWRERQELIERITDGWKEGGLDGRMDGGADMV